MRLASITVLLSAVVLSIPPCSSAAEEATDTVEVFQFEAALKRRSAVELSAEDIPEIFDADVLESGMLPVSVDPVSVDPAAVDLATPDEQSDAAAPTDGSFAEDESDLNRFLLPLPAGDWEVIALDDAEAGDQYAPPQEELDADPSVSDNGKSPYIVPPSPVCEDPEGRPLSGDLSDSLFKPLSDVRLTGSSTEPPLADEPGVTLSIPDNEACPYFTNDVPWVYQTEPQFAMLSPYRSPYPFTHYPLWYEDPNLERAGKSWGVLTTAKSATLMATQLVAWPINGMFIDMREPVLALPDVPAYHRFKPVDVFSEAHRMHNGYKARIVPIRHRSK